MIADLPFGAVVVVRIVGQPDRVDRIDAVHLEDLERIAGEHAAFELVTGP